MRKKLIITAAVIGLLLLSFWGFLEYRQYSSYKIPIHRDAAMIVKINVDEFIKSFLKEYGFNFGDKIKSNDKKQSRETSNTGIYFPGNIFIYILKDKLPSTFICCLPLSDENDFKLFANRNMGVSFSTADEATGNDGKLVIVCSKDYAAIAWSEQKEEIKPVLFDLLNKRNIIASDNKLIESLKRNRSHIVFAADKMDASASFSNNAIDINGIVELPDGFSVPENSIRIRSATSSYASFYLNMIPAPSAMKKEYTIKQYKLESDSLLQYYKGFTGINITGMTSQTDTVTTYEFDDNFEKKEKRTLTTVNIPRIEMIVQGKKNLFGYLQNQQFITDTGMINKEIFPLYKVSANQSGENIFLHTGEQIFRTVEFGDTQNFMEAEINFEKLKPFIDSTIFGKFSGGIKKITITGKKMGDKEVTIDSHVLIESGAMKTSIDLIKTLVK